MWSLAGLPARALNSGLPPGGNFDLSNWYLQLPTSNGILTGASGSVDSASAAQLVAGFTNSYFFTGPDGAMTFWVPDNGAITGGSSHPRSELRELIDPNNSSLNWTLYGTHRLSAQCKVLQVASDTQKVCIGQIHEPNYLTDGVTPGANNEQMIMFDLGNQKIYANINLDGDQSSSFSQTFISGSSVATNTTINYTMSVSNGVLTISVNNVTNAWNLFSGTNYLGHIAQNWDLASSNSVYFKAGDYNQTGNTCNCATDGARVAFYSLTTYHASAITNQPTGKAGTSGGNATFGVGAVGNGMLSYQWLMNGTNVLTGATNTTLTLSNLSGANLGNYSVIVSDSTPDFSSVTSSVAALTGNFPPVITSQPVDQSVATASNAIFTVGENGTAPLTNRWCFNTNTSLPWATGASLTITNAQATNTGNYFVIVSNKYGAVTSAVVALTLDLPPTITNQPAGLTVNAGSNTGFAVGVSGTPPLNYSWWLNGTNRIVGATNVFLNLTTVSSVNAGNYSAVITNNYGAVTSAVAALAVVYTVTITNAGSTNWICPAGVSSVQVDCWGGGGAGGSAMRVNTGNVFGGGGAGGCYAKKLSVPVTPGTNYTFSIGAGGASLTNDFATASGGDTIFTGDGGVSVIAKGGGGGQSRTNLTTSGVIGAGGTNNTAACIGDLGVAGGAGAAGKTSPARSGGGGGGGAGDNAGGGDASSLTNTAGAGGSGLIASGGNGGDGKAASSGFGLAGNTPGGGGGGARSSNSTLQFGGSGAAGELILTYNAGSCTAATAAAPIGNGGGTNGFTICPGQPITLAEIPTAGIAPFTFAWKKVGSSTVLGTSSNLVVATPASGDQYTCDVTSACGNGASTSPAATVTVSGLGVVLSAATQSVYRTMSVSVTATLSGSATGGIWTASGTGKFSSTNSLTTIYTPSVVDAGTTVNLTFTTAQSGSCAATTATDAVTFSQAVNPAKVVIIKADDFRGELIYGQQWTNFLQTARALGVKVSIGVICSNIIGSTSNTIAQWMRLQEAMGDVEFWDHAWDHTEWTDAGGQTVSEYEGSGLAYMQLHLSESQAAMSNALGHDVIAFGTAYNGFDTNTAVAINATPALRLFFASSVFAVRNDGLNAAVSTVKIIPESDGTGLPDFANFIATYPGGPTGPVALQFHPPYFINTNGTNSLLEFQKIVQYLQTNGYSILLPSEFVAALPAITDQPLSQSVLAGSNAIFTVGATGDPTLAYQWRFYGTNLVGATNSSLNINNVQTAATGSYFVVVTNASGSVTSAVAALTIKLTPVIAGAAVTNQTFQITCTGSPLESYLVLAKTNLADPIWLPIGTNVTDSDGVYIFTDAGFTNFRSRFYRLSIP